MVDAISSSSQRNFDPTHLPKGTEEFYNTKAFAQGQYGYIVSEITQSDEAAKRGNEALKEAITGET